MEEARHSLATALSVLRGRLGADAFDSSRDAVRLIQGRVTTDLDSLEVAFDSTLFPASFLEEFCIDDAPDFQQWCDAQRIRLLPRIQSVLSGQLSESRRQGNARWMEEVAERLRALDHLSEEAARAQLEARTIVGDRIGALRVFDDWKRRLATELGAVPSGDFERIATRLRLASLPSGHIGGLADQPTSAYADRGLSGRSQETQRCLEIWERATACASPHLLLRGCVGIGKSVLASQLATIINLRGAAVFQIRCAAAEQRIALGGILSLVTALCNHPGARAISPAHLKVLASWAPSLADYFPGISTTDEPSLPAAHVCLAEAISALISAIAGEQPVLLVIDDAHLVDEQSSAIIHYLLRRLLREPVMILLSAQIHRIGHTSHAAALIAIPNEWVQTVDLDPLSSDDARELIVGITGPLDMQHFQDVRAIIEYASGIPSTLSAIATEWQRAGKPRFRSSFSALHEDTPLAPADSHSEAIRSALLAVDDEALAFVQLASLLGSRMDHLELYEWIGLSLPAAARALRTLAANNIFVSANARVSFASQLARDCAYASLSCSHRASLHDIIGSHLMQHGVSSTEVDPLELGWHLGRGRTPAKAMEFLLTVGEDLLRQGHSGRLAAMLSDAPTVAASLNHSGFALLRAEALQEIGCWEASHLALESLPQMLSNTELAQERLLRITNDRFLGRLVGARLGEAITASLNIAGDNSFTPSLRTRAASTSTALISSSRNDKHIAQLGDVTSQLMAVPLAGHDALHAYHARAWFLAQRGGPRVALPVLLEGVTTISQTCPADSITTRLLLGAGVSLCQTGNYLEAAPVLHQAYSIAKALGNPAFIANAASGLALVEGRLGNPSAQISFAREAIRASSSEEWGICLLSAAYDQGLGLAIEGRLVEAESAMAAFDSRFDKRRPEWVQQAWKLCKADVLALAGKERKALLAGKIGTSGVHKKLHHDCFAGPYARWVAFTGIRTGTAAGALARLERQIEEIDRHDAKDQAEILAAIAILENSIGGNTEGKREAARERLGRLPGPTQSMIRRLGVSPVGEKGAWGIREVG
ncbi:MAG: AAA family ATPase [Gemmatimonadota bacterium]